MPDYSRILSLIDELRAELYRLASVQEAQTGGERLLAPQPASSGDSPYDRARVIPPTRTDQVDSIVGGRPTQSFPDCAAVGNETGYFCTGTLIAPNLVVTAKHCAQLPVTRVFLKGHDISELESGEVLAVKSHHQHPSADIMVLVLEKDATTTPRHIAQGPEIAAASPDEATLVGFGTIDFDGSMGYGVKRRVEVGITSLACGSTEEAEDYGCQQGLELVAGHRGLNKDSCRGDSGGPLYIRSAEGDYSLLGATSRGIGPRTCGDGGIYVRVDQFIEWIRQETGIEIEGPRL
jgi:secreted trypsin-like serine protease